MEQSGPQQSRSASLPTYHVTENTADPLSQNSAEEPKKKIRRKSKSAKMQPLKLAESEDRTPCMLCEVLYCDSKVSWYACKKCKKCKNWVCATCARIGRSKDVCV